MYVLVWSVCERASDGVNVGMISITKHKKQERTNAEGRNLVWFGIQPVRVGFDLFILRRENLVTFPMKNEDCLLFRCFTLPIISAPVGDTLTFATNERTWALSANVHVVTLSYTTNPYNLTTLNCVYIKVYDKNKQKKETQRKKTHYYLVFSCCVRFILTLLIRNIFSI